MKIILAGMILLMVARPLTAAENTANPPASSQPAVIDATDKAAVDSVRSKNTIVEGVVSRAQWSRSGRVMNIHFRDSEMTAAVFEKNRAELDKTFGGDLAKAVSGAKVRITGKVSEYRGHPEIIISNPEQITVLQAPPASQPTTQP